MINFIFKNKPRFAAGIALSFDDDNYAPGWKSYHDNHGASRGWKATFNIYSASSFDGQTVNIKYLYDAGHELGNHSVYSGPIVDNYMQTHTPAEYYAEYVQPLDASIRTFIPYFEGTKSFAWQFGFDRHSVSQYLVQNTPIKITRDVGADYRFSGFYDGTNQIVKGYVTDSISGRTLADWQDLIDEAIAGNKILLALGHEITSLNPANLHTDITLLNGIIDYVNKRGLTMYKFNQLLPSLWD